MRNSVCKKIRKRFWDKQNPREAQLFKNKETHTFVAEGRRHEYQEAKRKYKSKEEN